jgi:excinuclease UvrABC helicase subunit UvrB
MKPAELKKQSETIRKEMEKAARDLDFPLAARLRDELAVIESMLA